MAEINTEELMREVKNLQAQVKVNDDIEKIKQLTERCINARNASDTDDELNYYSEDAVLDLGQRQIKGKANIGEIARAHAPKPGSPAPATKAVSFLAHPIITVGGDKAKGRWNLFTMHCLTSTYQSLFWVQSEFNAEYTRMNGEWKISYLAMAPKIGPPHPPMVANPPIH
jgi:hypothetical protein